MYVSVDERASVSLQERDNFKAFKVVTQLPRTALQNALDTCGNVGWIDASGHAWVFESWLRAQGAAAGERAAPFEAMVGFARKQGWWDSERSAIRAHIEPAAAVQGSG
jgi:hypothetical protein